MFNKLPKFWLSFFMIALTFQGCGVWRSLPAHGGGKRLDEEQRIIAGAIRTAIANIDVAALEGKEVILNITSMSHDGGGQVTNPGISSLSAQWSEYDTRYHPNNTRDYYRDGWDAGVSVETRPNLRATAFRSQTDMDYFNASLIMKLRMSNVSVSEKSAPVTLFIIVDILGTNLSTEDLWFIWNDNLKATCEFTYFALENDELLLKPQSVAAISSYTEKGSLFYLYKGNEFYMTESLPTGFPCYGENELKKLDNGARIEASVRNIGPKNNSDVAAMLQQAESYINAKQYDAAERVLNDIMKVDPNYPRLDAVRSQLQNERGQNDEHQNVRAPKSSPKK